MATVTNVESGGGPDPEVKSSGAPSRAELIEAWIRAYRRPPPKGISTRLLAYAAAYNAQVRQFGGLKPSVHRALHELAAGPETQTPTPGKWPKVVSVGPGTRLVREWHGKTHIVDVLDDGVSYQGRTYRSLSEVARIITGARWSGPRFFGL